MAFDFNSCRLVGPDENRVGSGLIIPPVGVSFIVSNGIGVERCHELALAMIRESLLKKGLKEAVIFSRRGKVKGRYLTFAQGAEGEGCFNRWPMRSFAFRAFSRMLSARMRSWRF